MEKRPETQAELSSRPDQIPKTILQSPSPSVSLQHDGSPRAPDDLPRLKFEYRWWAVVLYIVFLMFFNLLFPCLTYYLIRIYGKTIDLQTNIGISSAALGLSSCFDAPFRLYKLVRYRKRYGPLNDDVFWHADFFMWTYTICLFCFSFPLAIAPALEPVDVNFFLMSMTFLITPFGLILLATLLPIRSVPFWLSSHPPNTKDIKPGIFYVTEDIAAVDFSMGRPYRAQLYQRYSASPPFRRLMRILTLYFGLACLALVGLMSAVVWGAEEGNPYTASGEMESLDSLDFRFAWVLAQVFIWAGVVGLGCWMIVRWGLRKEQEWWDSRGVIEKGGASV